MSKTDSIAKIEITKETEDVSSDPDTTPAGAVEEGLGVDVEVVTVVCACFAFRSCLAIARSAFRSRLRSWISLMRLEMPVRFA